LVAPAALALLADAYPTPTERARALGIFQGSTAAGATAGIVLGGFLTEYLGWRWVLLVNPPVIILLMLAMLRRLPAIRPTRRTVSLDLPGAALITAAVAALIYGLGEGQDRGFDHTPVVITLVVAVLLGVAFLINETRAAEPMLPLNMLRAPDRQAALGVMFLLGAVVAGYVFFISLYLQRVLGLSAVLTGLALVPATGTVLLVSTFVTRRLLARFSVRLILLGALTLVAAGQFWLSRVSSDGSYPVDVLAGIMLTAAGMGLAFPTVSYVVTSGVGPSERGIAGGLLVTAQQVGAAVGLAVLATVGAARASATDSLTDGYRLSYLTSTGLVIVAAVLLLVRLRRPTR
jgi:MFS family permease